MESSLAFRFGRVVRELRHQRGWSQEQFADKCGLHRTYVGSIERGEKTVTIETAQKLARSFEISLSQLFEKLEGDDAGAL